jgi:hypothetical protein
MVYTPKTHVIEDVWTADIANDLEQGVYAAHEHVDALTVNVQNHGAVGTWNGTSGADDGAAILAAVAAVQAAGSGGSVYFPPLPSGRRYRSTVPLPNVSNIRYYGAAATACRVDFTASDMLAPTGALYNVLFENLYLVAVGGHLVDLGTVGGFNFGRFENCILNAAANTSSIIHQPTGSGDFIENLFINCDMHRPATSTVPAFNIINTAGGANANVWKKCRATSNNCDSTPFWRIEASVTGTYTYDNHWEDIVGEQNAGGLIHVYSANGVVISNVHDYDAGTYDDHVIKIDTSATSTTNSTTIDVRNSGRRGGTLNTGIMDFYAAFTTRDVTLSNVGNHTTTPVYQVPETNGSMVFGRLGAAYPSKRFRMSGGAVFAHTDAPLTVSPTYSSGRGLELFEGVTGYAGQVLHLKKFADAGDHMVADGNGKFQWGAGAGTFDVSLERTAAGTLGVGAGHAIRTGRAVTGSRPSASTVGAGAMFYDTTLSKPIWSDGTVWRDAAGTSV